MKQKLEQKKIDFIGKHFDRWTVLSFAKKVKYTRKNGKSDWNNLWNCICECGTKREVTETSLKMKKSKSCGCLSREVASARTLPNDGAIKNKLYSSYKYQAIKRNYSFNLSLEEFNILIKGNCFYCGIPPLQKNISNYSSPDFTYNGIDRIDNSIGYENYNVVSCCGVCNQAKMDLSYKDFISLIVKIYNKHTNI